LALGVGADGTSVWGGVSGNGCTSRTGRRLRVLGSQPYAEALDRLQARQRWPRHARDPGLLGPSVDCLDRALHSPRAGSLQALLARLRGLSERKVPVERTYAPLCAHCWRLTTFRCRSVSAKRLHT